MRRDRRSAWRQDEGLFFRTRSLVHRFLKPFSLPDDALSMALVPVKLAEKITFFKCRLGAFAEHAAELGLTEAEVADLQAKVDAARAAQLAQGRALSAARSATGAYNLAVDAMSKAGAAAIMKIRGQAESTGDPKVYQLALIPPIAKRSPIDAPGTPYQLEFTLPGAGMLELSWKCKNPKGATGTTYYLSRRLGPSGPFTFLAIVGGKQFVDETIPAGTAHIEYQIQAIRTTKAGQPAIFPIDLGTDGRRMPKFNVPSRTVIAA